MKKIFFLLVAVFTVVLYNYAEPVPTTSESESSSYSQATAQIYYEGPAYSSAQDGLVPHVDSSVSVYWTSDGCSVNGQSGYTVRKIDGNFAMYVNGKAKFMTRFVSYKGERYYFQY